jgi:hypothetical protein
MDPLFGAVDDLQFSWCANVEPRRKIRQAVVSGAVIGKAWIEDAPAGVLRRHKALFHRRTPMVERRELQRFFGGLERPVWDMR